MKNLKKFATVAEYNAFIEDIDPLDYPVTSYIAETQETKFDNDYSNQYLTIEMLEDGSLDVMLNNKVIAQHNFQYLTDKEEGWNTVTIPGGTTKSWTIDDLTAGQKVYFKTTNGDGEYYLNITSEQQHKAYGSISYSGFRRWQNLFNGNSGLISAENLKLTEPFYGNGNYYTFAGCTALIKAPKEMTVPQYNGWYIFNNCNNLETAPLLNYSRCPQYRISFPYNGKLNRINIKNLNIRDNYSCKEDFPVGTSSKQIFIIGDNCSWTNYYNFFTNRNTNLKNVDLIDFMASYRGAKRLYIDQFKGNVLLMDGYDNLTSWWEDYADYAKQYILVDEAFSYDGNTYLLWAFVNPDEANELCLNCPIYLLTGNLQTLRRCVEDNFTYLDNSMQDWIEQGEDDPWSWEYSGDDFEHCMVALINIDGETQYSEIDANMYRHIPIGLYQP